MVQNLPQSLKGLAHLVLVDNPDFNKTGDFSLAGEKVSTNTIAKHFTLLKKHHFELF